MIRQVWPTAARVWVQLDDRYRYRMKLGAVYDNGKRRIWNDAADEDSRSVAAINVINSALTMLIKVRPTFSPVLVVRPPLPRVATDRMQRDRPDPITPHRD